MQPVAVIQVVSMTIVVAIQVVCMTVLAIYQAVAAAKVADAVVIIVGLNQAVENVDVDRTDLLLPDNQQHLIQVIANSTDKTIVLVVMSGGPVDVSAQKDDKRIPCIHWVGYPGQEGGTAIAQTIFGDHNPGNLFGAICSCFRKPYKVNGMIGISVWLVWKLSAKCV